MEVYIRTDISKTYPKKETIVERKKEINKCELKRTTNSAIIVVTFRRKKRRRERERGGS